MSIFKNILAKIFPTDHPANAPTKPGAGTSGQSTAGPTDTSGVKTTPSPAGAAASPTPTAPSSTSGSSTAGMPSGTAGTTSNAAPASTLTGMPGGSGATGASPASSVDVDAVLRELQAKNTENLNWKTSIVDLLKLLGLDSSMAARRELAAELHYSGNTEDSAAMNMWLHKEVIRKLAENGGKLPEELRH